MKTKSKTGFTLIELLIGTTIIALLLATGMASYVDYNRKRRVRESALELLNNFRFVQEKSLSGEKPSSASCGVLDGWKLEFINNKEYFIQAVCSGVGVGETKPFKLDEGVTKTSGASSYLFRVLALGVNFSGSGEIQFSGFGRVERIVVEKTGNIYREEAVILPTTTPTPTTASTPTPTLTPTPTCVQDMFGKTNIGSGIGLWGSNKWMSRYQLSANANVTSLSFYGRWGGSGSSTLNKGYIYADSGGAPAQLMGTTNEIIVDSIISQWWTLEFPSPVSLSPGTYWLGVVGEQPGTNSYRDFGDPTQFAYKDNAYYPSEPIDPCQSPSGYNAYAVSIYATYCEP